MSEVFLKESVFSSLSATDIEVLLLVLHSCFYLLSFDFLSCIHLCVYHENRGEGTKPKTSMKLYQGEETKHTRL